VQFGEKEDAVLLNEAKNSYKVAIITEITGLLALGHFEHTDNKIKMRSSTQIVVAHFKTALGKIQTAEEAKTDPMSLLPKALADRFRGALKLR